MASFANPKRLEEHFFDHGREFGSISETEYAIRAAAFLTRQGDHDVQQCSRSSGDKIRFSLSTGEFGVLAADGLTIRTYYKPVRCVDLPANLRGIKRCHNLPTNEAYFKQECLK